MSTIDGISASGALGAGTAANNNHNRHTTSAAEFREIMQAVNQPQEARQAQVEESEDKTRNAADEFSRYMAMSTADKIKHSLLQEMGLTEEEYEALPPEEKQKIDDKVAERLAELNDPETRANSDEHQQQVAERLQAMLVGLNAQKENDSITDIT